MPSLIAFRHGSVRSRFVPSCFVRPHSWPWCKGGVSSSRCAWHPRRVVGRSRARRPAAAVVLMVRTLGPNSALNTDAHRRGFAPSVGAG